MLAHHFRTSAQSARTVELRNLQVFWKLAFSTFQINDSLQIQTSKSCFDNTGRQRKQSYLAKHCSHRARHMGCEDESLNPSCNIQNGEFKICKNQVSLFKTLSPLQLRKDPKASFLLQTARERLEPQQNLLTDRITQHKQPSSNSQIAKVGRRKRDMDDWYQPDGKTCFRSLWVVPLDLWGIISQHPFTSSSSHQNSVLTSPKSFSCLDWLRHI